MAGNANSEGYIRLHRKFLEWEWYGDINTSRLFLHMLFKANWRPGRFMGVEVARGEFVSSYSTLADESGLSIRSVRTALTHLISTGEVTVKRHAKFSVFTIKNYSKYQDADTQSDNHVTQERHRSDTGATTIEESKKEKREKDNNKYTCAFEALWQEYPRKKDKGMAYKQYQARLRAGFSEDELMTAVKRYSCECESKHTDPQYIKHCATFLGPSTPFADYLKEEEQKENGNGRIDYGYKESDI